MKRIILSATAMIAAGLAFAPPVFAQDNSDSAAAQDSGEKVNQLIVYGDDPCPQSTSDQITVCARKDESERYRIPEPLRGSQSPENEAWNNRVIAYETVGRGGTLSCSPVGGGGWTGCVNQMIETAMAEKQSDPSLKFSELIAEERAKRLATIDTKAEEQQAEVEEAEREYFDAKKKAGEEAKPADSEATSAPASAEQPAPAGE